MIKIPVSKPKFDKREWENLKECIESSWISSAGHFINDFEEKFAEYCGTKYAISTCNGTAALHLALLGLGIGVGDEVIIPALTFVATANSVTYTGARPVFADIDSVAWTIDSTQVEKHITKKTKAIIAVHLYGYPADMSGLRRLADKHGLFLIEDAAEALGSSIRNTNWKRAGSLGDVGCFSFYGNKIITTGEGGMITLNDKKLADKIRIFKNHGEKGARKYYHPVVGYNFRMTNLQAAVGLAQLQKINKFLKLRKEIDKLYRKYLKDIPGIKFPPDDSEDLQGVCWLFSVLINNRDRLMKYLYSEGIETRPFFVPMHKLPMYKSRNRFPVAERVSKTGLNLPTFADMTEKQVAYIAKCIKSSRGRTS